MLGNRNGFSGEMAIRLNKWILCSCLAAIFGFLKSLFSKKAGKEKLDLPLAKRQGPDGQEDTNEPEEDLQNWDSWDDGGGLTGVTVDPAEPEEKEDDFFADMTPSFKKAALIRKKTAKASVRYATSNVGSIQLGIDDTANLTDELGAWTDTPEGGWEDEALDEDLEQEADSVLREKREAERRRRLAEQQRKKAEREAQRSNQRASKLAVKLK